MLHLLSSKKTSVTDRGIQVVCIFSLPAQHRIRNLSQKPTASPRWSTAYAAPPAPHLARSYSPSRKNTAYSEATSSMSSWLACPCWACSSARTSPHGMKCLCKTPPSASTSALIPMQAMSMFKLLVVEPEMEEDRMTKTKAATIRSVQYSSTLFAFFPRILFVSLQLSTFHIRIASP